MFKEFENIFKDKSGKYMYPTALGDLHAYRRYASSMAKTLEEKINRQYAEFDSGNAKELLRPSMVGKSHPFDILMSKFHFSYKTNLDEKSKLIFSLGDWFEAWVGYTLRRMGYSLLENVEVTWEGMRCHIDFVVKDDYGTETIIEVKTANSRYFNQVRENGVTDERGYLSQLLVYSASLGMPAIWLFVNKDTMDMMFVHLEEVCPPELIDSKIKSISRLCQQYQSVETENEIYEMYSPPPPAIEKDRYGDYKLPLRCYIPNWAHYPELYYNIQSGKTQHGQKRDYVVSFKYPEFYEVPDVTATAVEYDGDRSNENWMIKKFYTGDK
jgi:hypothetical protein